MTKQGSARQFDRPMAPGAGLVIAGLASTILWGMIAGIVAIV